MHANRVRIHVWCHPIISVYIKKKNCGMPSTVVVAVTDDGLSNTWTSAVPKKKKKKRRKKNQNTYCMWDYSILLRSGRWLNILDSFRFAYLFCCCTASRIYCVANKRVLLSSGLWAALNWLCPSLLFVVIIRYWLRPLQSSANVRWCEAIRIDMHFIFLWSFSSFNVKTFHF